MTAIALLLALLAPDIATWSRQGADAMRAGRFTEAEQAYRALRKADPNNPMWRLNLGLALQSTGRYAEAATEFQSVVKARPEPGPGHLLLGLAHLKLARPCDAIAPLETATKWNAQRSLLELADAYYGCKRWEAAARTYEKASTEPKVLRQAAHCYWQARLYEPAERLFQALMAEYANEPQFAYEFGDTLARRQGAAAGVEWLERAVQADPLLIPARGELGKALVEVGRSQEAIAHLEAAAERDPALLLPLSRAYKAVGRDEDARRVGADYRKKMNN